jgi:hypothetical protein
VQVSPGQRGVAMDKMLRALNGNRGDAAFLSNKGLDSVRLKLRDDSLRCTYAWKTWLLFLCFGLFFGPGVTAIIIREMEKKGQKLAGLIDELGYYFAIAGGLMIAGMWLLVFHSLLSRRYVKFDFKSGQVVFRYFGFGNFRYVISLAEVSSVVADTIFRRESESHPPRFNASHVLTLSLRDGRAIKVFETRNQDIARQAADIVDARLKSDKEAVTGKTPKGHSGLGW